MLCLDHVNCSVVSEQLYYCAILVKEHVIIINISYHANLNIVVILSRVASYYYAFFNILRSFRVCVHARVVVHAYESGRNYIHVRNKNCFEGIMLVENEPPAAKAGYGPEDHGDKHIFLYVIDNPVN